MPAPTTIAVSLSDTGVRATACTATEIASIIAAFSNGSEAGSL